MGWPEACAGCGLAMLMKTDYLVKDIFREKIGEVMILNAAPVVFDERRIRGSYTMNHVKEMDEQIFRGVVVRTKSVNERWKENVVDFPQSFIDKGSLISIFRRLLLSIFADTA